MGAQVKKRASELLALVDEYYDRIGGGLDPSGKIPTIERCMLYIGYTRQSIYDWGMGKRTSDNISYIIARIRDRQQQWAVERGMALEADGQRTDFTRVYLDRYYPVASKQEVKIDAAVKADVALSGSVMAALDQVGSDGDQS